MGDDGVDISSFDRLLASFANVDRIIVAVLLGADAVGIMPRHRVSVRSMASTR